jgi:cation:H+ antiporter
MTLASPLPMLIASLDGVISRVDGVVLLSLSIALIAFVVHTARTHPLLQVKAQKLDKAARVRPGWWPAALLIGGSLAIVAGAELFSWSVKGVLEWLGWSGTRFGMLIVAAAVSAEEIPRMLSAARRGHSEVSVGNILGTVMFFTLFNLGIIALVQPLPMERSTMTFYWPAMYVALAIVVALLWRGKVSRLAGVTLLVAFAGYVAAATTWF